MGLAYLIDDEFFLEKFPGKGGWTYARIPQIQQDSSKPFGWVTVQGYIDSYPLKHFKLMPMGEGRLFLPVKAAIREKIHKQVGDTVTIQLKLDETTVEIPQELLSCFDLEKPELFEIFQAFTENEKHAYISWIYSAKTDGTKVERIAKMMIQLEKGLRLHD